MYFKDENGEKIKENFKLSQVNSTTDTQTNVKDSTECGFRFDTTTILLLIALLIVAVMLWKYDAIFKSDMGAGAIENKV